ncbi:hypothetical protein GE09DRAFT_490165 [Coniochaeta sp. 2T2.1]|nr:hypothetical protein GE09DRAFT_490165 [Coniochaeta sp. 2T2.1]
MFTTDVFSKWPGTVKRCKGLQLRMLLLPIVLLTLVSATRSKSMPPSHILIPSSEAHPEHSLPPSRPLKHSSLRSSTTYFRSLCRVSLGGCNAWL